VIFLLHIFFKIVNDLYYL